MRRKERQVSQEDAIQTIQKACVCRLGMIDGDRPYVLPINFGYTWQNGFLTLYFHCAQEGRKLDILSQNNRVCFEIDGSHRLIEAETGCQYSFAYESVIGEGTMHRIEDEAEKTTALRHIMHQLTGREDFSFSAPHLKAVCVLKLVVEDFTGKRANIS